MVRNKELEFVNAWGFGNTDIYYKEFKEAKDEVELHGMLGVKTNLLRRKKEVQVKEEKEHFEFHFPSIPHGAVMTFLLFGALMISIFFIIPQIFPVMEGMANSANSSVADMFENIQTTLPTIFPMVALVLIGFVVMMVITGIGRNRDWD
jgi:hypothetical protein